MIQKLADRQNWAKAAQVLAVITAVLLFVLFRPNDPLFWAFVNIPLYLLHQTEEHLWPGGFKGYVNHVVNGLPQGQESLTDINVLWINVLLVWAAFAVFGGLSFLNIGFGLLIIVFSAINCLMHIGMALRHRRWNPGSAVGTLQLLVSAYAAWFITAHGLQNAIAWWVGTVVFSAAVHVVLFRTILRNK